MRRIIVAVLVALTTLVGLTGCTASMDKADVESKLKTEISKQGSVEKVTCPGDLKAKVGETMTCKIISAGKPHDVKVTVTKVDGSNIRFSWKVVS